jgi:hypothetical protein
MRTIILPTLNFDDQSYDKVIFALIVEWHDERLSILAPVRKIDGWMIYMDFDNIIAHEIAVRVDVDECGAVDTVIIVPAAEMRVLQVSLASSVAFDSSLRYVRRIV